MFYLDVIAESKKMAYLSSLQSAPEHSQYDTFFVRWAKEGERAGVVRWARAERRKIKAEKDGVWKLKNYI